MPTHIALLRGINVGRAKRIAMADLRAVVAELGHTNVRTLLNSGNVVFDSARRGIPTIAASIRDAIAEKTGVTCEVVVVSAADLDVIVSENSLGPVVTNPSRYLVAFPSAASALSKASAARARRLVTRSIRSGEQGSVSLVRGRDTGEQAGEGV